MWKFINEEKIFIDENQNWFRRNEKCLMKNKTWLITANQDGHVLKQKSSSVSPTTLFKL